MIGLPSLLPSPAKTLPSLSRNPLPSLQRGVGPLEVALEEIEDREFEKYNPVAGCAVSYLGSGALFI
jgi:hypothetical protein